MLPEELVKSLNSSRAETEAALEGLDPDQEIDAASEWRIKDIIAHLTAWEEAVVSSIEAWQIGRKFTLPENMSNADIKDRQFARRYDFPTERIFNDWHYIRERFVQLVGNTKPEKLKDARLMFPWNKPGTLPKLVKAMIAHERKHIADIVRLTKQTPD